MINIIKYILKIILSFWVFFLETPIFLLNRKQIFNSDKIVIVNENSLGHAFAFVDYVSRIFYPNKISLLWIINHKTNKYIPLCFNNIETFYVHSHRIFINLDKIRFSSINFYLRFFSFFFDFDILRKETVYQTLSISKNSIKIGREQSSRPEFVKDWTGYEFLLHNNIGLSPVFPSILEDDLISNFKAEYLDFFANPIVCLLLREKGSGDSFDNYIRSSGDQENYIDIVKYLTSNGYSVIGLGETSEFIFNDIKGFYHAKKFKYDYEILNLYFLMNSQFFIGQQSGPLLIPNSCKIPCLIVDAMPYCLGTFSKLDFILFKKLYINSFSYENELSLEEIFNSHTDLALGYNYKNKGIIVKENTSKELLTALIIFLSYFKNTLNSLQNLDFHLINSKNLANEEMRIFFQENTIIKLNNS
jgi:putative glycosyltransferase (TIGR04372 family)